jgi:hypothetical protein
MIFYPIKAKEGFMRIYTLRVSIIGIPKLYRIIEASGNCTFDDLHAAIFEAYDRFDYHLYSFFITREDTSILRTIYAAPEITHPDNVQPSFGSTKKRKSSEKTRIGTVGLNEGDVFHYLFDFGDDWWHRIRVQKIFENQSKGKHMVLIKSVGASPPQYPEYDEEDED